MTVAFSFDSSFSHVGLLKRGTIDYRSSRHLNVEVINHRSNGLLFVEHLCNPYKPWVPCSLILEWNHILQARVIEEEFQSWFRALEELNGEPVSWSTTSRTVTPTRHLFVYPLCRPQGGQLSLCTPLCLVFIRYIKFLSQFWKEKKQQRQILSEKEQDRGENLSRQSLIYFWADVGRRESCEHSHVNNFCLVTTIIKALTTVLS